MSLRLPVIDVSSATVGSTYSIPLNIRDLGDPSNPNDQPPTLQIANESGCGFAWQAQTEGDSGYLQAGKWMDLTVIPGEVSINLLVVYVLNNPPVSQVQPTYFYAGETPDPIGQLGNSPISGSTATSLNTLSNEGSSSSTLAIDLGDTAFAQLVKMFVGGQSTWSVDQSGVKHQVFNIQAAGNPLQLGQAGDITEVLGQLKVDQLETNIGAAINPTSVHLVGGTAGTADMYQLLVGTVKLILIKLTGFQTGASNQNMAIPTPFTAGLQLWAGDTSNFSLLKSAVAQTINLYTSFAGTGGSSTPVTLVHIVSQGDCPQAIDTVQFASGGASTHSGIIVLLGV